MERQSKLKTFPKSIKRNSSECRDCFQSPTNRTDYIVTNDEACFSSYDAQEVCAKRWKIEHFHLELKQTAGIEKYQCRKARIQKNHIACAILVWVRLKKIVHRPPNF